VSSARDFERPAFAATFPRDPELDRLVEYFARGNHRAVREGAEALAKKTDDPAVATAARELRERIEPDPMWKILLGVTLVLLVTLTYWAVHRGRQLRSEPVPIAPRTVQTITK
jgi:hypothetical protein